MSIPGTCYDDVLLELNPPYFVLVQVSNSCSVSAAGDRALL
jgi:hypothetical protein